MKIGPIEEMLEAHKEFNDTWVSGAKASGERFTNSVNRLATARARLQVWYRDNNIQFTPKSKK